MLGAAEYRKKFAEMVEFVLQIFANTHIFGIKVIN